MSGSLNISCCDETVSHAANLDTVMEGPDNMTSDRAANPLGSHTVSAALSIHSRRENKRFATKMALLSTLCSAVALFLLTALFSEWSINDALSSLGIQSLNNGISYEYNDGGRHSIDSDQWWEEDEFTSHTTNNHRHLEQEDAEDNNNQNGNDANEASGVADGDYSAYRCDDIFVNTPSPSDESESSSSSTKRCQYAKTCDEGSGLLFPFVFCQTSILTTAHWLLLLSPLLLLALTLLFRLLGSTAEEYFSPSLEMFSVKLGLPPRFAGVTLLALGNGAADVSATMNAIASDPENGYKMSLGALTGAAMFITTVVAGSVILANGGVVCRGALVRDVMALGVTVVVVTLNLEKGVVGPGTESFFISLYVIFVLIVLVADVYHRAVMLPRIRHETEMREHQRQLEAERAASMQAGDLLNEFSMSLDGRLALNDHVTGSSSDRMSGGAAAGQVGSGAGAVTAMDDDRTHASAPPQMVDTNPALSDPAVKNRALNAVLTALSNYNDEELDEDDVGMDNHRRRGPNGWGIESSMESSREWDRPVVLHGADGILTRHPHSYPQTADGMDSGDDFQSPYRVMEDMDAIDRICVQDGSQGYPAHNWYGAFHDGKQELMVHFKEYWRDIIDDEESGALEKFLLVCEFPATCARKLTVSIPCEGSYCRALVALSFALSPLWLGVYCLGSFDVNLWGWQMGVFCAITFLGGLMVMRFAPGGDGTMATVLAVPIALYGFVIAASWIDWIADKLVALLEFLGIILRIPNYIMGLTVLAWGNSMADLSANVTMARKGLANMAITACFAGPVFNILIGLGAGFGVLRNVTKTEVNYVHLTPAITTGFVFCFINCGLLLVSGLAINKGVIPAGYGYAACVLYTAYIATSLLLQFLL